MDIKSGMASLKQFLPLVKIFQNTFYLLCITFTYHYSDVIMGMMASQIMGISIVCSTVCSEANQRKSSELVTGLCEGYPRVTDGLPSQRACNVEKVSIWWRHHMLGVPAKPQLYAKPCWYHLSQAPTACMRPESSRVIPFHPNQDIGLELVLIITFVSDRCLIDADCSIFSICDFIWGIHTRCQMPLCIQNPAQRIPLAQSWPIWRQDPALAEVEDPRRPWLSMKREARM